MGIRFNKVDGFNKVYDRTRCLVLFGPENLMQFTIGLDVVKRIRISQESGVTYIFFNYNYARSKIDPYDSLPLEKRLTLHNLIVFIKSVFNKIQIGYYYNILLEKRLHKLPISNDNK